MAETIINYTGIPSFSTIDKLLTKFRAASYRHDLNFKTYKKMVTVMIESLENVCKYSDEYTHFLEDAHDYLPTFSINKNSDRIQLITTNPVRNDHVEKLRAHIEGVNHKSRDELKQLYLETIDNGKFTRKGGAGLGFIEMAKTSGNDLEFSFEPISEEYSLYTFKVTFSI